MWAYNNTDELYHYGILGMKWGHRKTISNFLERQANKNVNRSNKLSRKLNKHGIGGENGYTPEFAKRRNAQMMTKGLQDGKLKKIPKGYKKVGDKILTDKQAKKQSNKKSKKMSMKKKIAIGAAVTAGVIAGAYAHKKIKDYKAELNRDNKKYSEYRKKVREIINNKKMSDDKWEKEMYNIYTHPNPLTGELRGVPKARKATREMKSRNLNFALREIEDLNRKTFSNKYETSKVKKGSYTSIPTLKSLGFGKDSLEDHVKYFKNEEDMRKEISNFMGKTNRKKSR